jgi:hypothetical protein
MAPSDLTAEGLLLIATNLIVCLVGIAMCICRQGYMRKSTTKKIIRAQYSMWTGLFTASAISWTFGEPATVIQLCMSSAVLVHLVLGFEAWRWGAPSYTFRETRKYEAASD